MNKIYSLMAMVLLAVLVSGCMPQEMYFQQATMTASVATATRQAQDAQATATVVEIRRQATQAAVDAADAETRLLLARATQTVMAAQTAVVVEATQQAVRAEQLRATEAARALATQQAFTREGWTATVQAEERAATAVAAERTYQAAQTQAAVSATWTAQAMMLMTTATVVQIRADATSVLAVAGIADEQYRQEQVLTSQAEWGKYAWVVVGVLASLAAIGLVSYAGFNVARTRAVTQIVQRGALGESPVVLINNRAIVADASMNPTIDPERPLLMPVEAQSRHALAQATVRALQAAGHGPAARQLMEPEVVSAPNVVHELPMAVEWREMSRRKPGMLLLGAGEAGLVHARQDTPHVLMAGQTGSGKSTGMRCIITQHLLDGRRVTILDKSGRDFGVFAELATVITFDASDPDMAISGLIAHMRAAWNEVIRRQRESRPTWRGVVDVLVVDELDNWQDLSMDGDTTPRRLWQYPRMISKEGRGSGIYLLVASQNPTAASIDIGMRRNTTPVAFRLADLQASQTVISSNEAVGLPTGQFVARLESNVRGVGFNPSDDDIAASLRGLKPLGRPEWLDGAMVQAALPVAVVEDTTVETIRDLHRQGLSMNMIARTVFGYAGGQAYEKVRAALDTGSTTTTTPVVLAE